MRALCSSNPRIIDGGTADPPQPTFRTVVSFLPVALRCASSAIHTVGTPSRHVTFSFSISSVRLGASRLGPGNTIFAPTQAAEYGTPQALTWNIGTTGRIVSRDEKSSASGSAIAYECRTV